MSDHDDDHWLDGLDGPGYFDRQGHRITLRQWGALFERTHHDELGRSYRIVAADELGDVTVSTVWLGLNHNWNTAGPPLIFETMIFGGDLDGEQWRYSTEAEALEGHRAAVSSSTAPA